MSGVVLFTIGLGLLVASAVVVIISSSKKVMFLAIAVCIFGIVSMVISSGALKAK
jgi:hypothetical protein